MFGMRLTDLFLAAVAFNSIPRFGVVNNYYVPRRRNEVGLASFSLWREATMPLYFFHLTFGSRVVSDEEGVDLRNRAAAREEGLAIIRELSHRTDSNSRRWASWFLHVSDEAGQFLRLPVGQPALELVANNAPQIPSAAPERKRNRRHRVPNRQPVPVQTLPALVHQIAVHLEHVAQLLELSRKLQKELSSQCLRSGDMSSAARRVASYAWDRSAHGTPIPSPLG
jgi:hypothetical protein